MMQHAGNFYVEYVLKRPGNPERQRNAEIPQPGYTSGSPHAARKEHLISSCLPTGPSGSSGIGEKGREVTGEQSLLDCRGLISPGVTSFWSACVLHGDFLVFSKALNENFCQFIHPPICPSLCRLVHLSTCPSIIRLSIRPPIHPSIQ